MRFISVFFACLLFCVAGAQPSSQPSSSPNKGLTTFDPETPIVSPQPESLPAPATIPTTPQPLTFLIAASFQPDDEYYLSIGNRAKISIYATGTSLTIMSLLTQARPRFSEESFSLVALAGAGVMATAPSLGRLGRNELGYAAIYAVLRFTSALTFVSALSDPAFLAQDGSGAVLTTALGTYLFFSAFECYRLALRFPGNPKKRAKRVVSSQ